MDYKDCKVLCNINRSDIPITTAVEVDEFTEMVQNNFDYEFTGQSVFYPYKIPSELLSFKDNFGVMAIVGASGSGKSTLLKKFNSYMKEFKTFNDKAIVSNFKNPIDASEKLSAVGLNSMPVWCRPRKVLSVGEGFRADLALNIESDRVFDEFTSTIDRNVAKSTCNSIRKYINEKQLKNIVFCSCHNDYISYLKPDFVIDLDEEKVFDCRGEELGKILNYKSTSPQTKINGIYLGSITI